MEVEWVEVCGSGDDVRELSSARRSKFPPNLSPQLASGVQAGSSSRQFFAKFWREDNRDEVPALSFASLPSNFHYDIMVS